jgi:hypothetical protein
VRETIGACVPRYLSFRSDNPGAVQFLPEDEGAQLRFAFEAEVERLQAA